MTPLLKLRKSIIAREPEAILLADLAGVSEAFEAMREALTALVNLSDRCTDTPDDVNDTIQKSGQMKRARAALALADKVTCGR